MAKKLIGYWVYHNDDGPKKVITTWTYQFGTFTYLATSKEEEIKSGNELPNQHVNWNIMDDT